MQKCGHILSDSLSLFLPHWCLLSLKVMLGIGFDLEKLFSLSLKKKILEKGKPLII